MLWNSRRDGRVRYRHATRWHGWRFGVDEGALPACVAHPSRAMAAHRIRVDYLGLASAVYEG